MAATNIQDAVDVAVSGDLVLVNDGLYQAGGRAVFALPTTPTNRVAVTKPLKLQSVNGPAATIIQGHQHPGTTNGIGTMRCAYLTNGASLTGFTLMNGATDYLSGNYYDDSGGGVLCEARAVVSNCVMVGCSAGYGGGSYGGTLYNCLFVGNQAVDGGGAYLSRLVNCVLSSNYAEFTGGGAYSGTLTNCTIVGNSAGSQGAGFGGAGSLAKNCIVYYNSAGAASNTYNAVCQNCCTMPLPAFGSGNVTNEPLFMDLAGGNLRLQPGSPCINSGRNAAAPTGPDFDGNPRIVGGTVDIGAYEFQSPSSVLSYAWAQSYGLPTDGSADYTDTDGDGMSNWQEWIAGTDPTNPQSKFLILSVTNSVSGVRLTWSSGSGRTYTVQRATSSSGNLEYSSVATVSGGDSVTSYTDGAATNAGAYFYRVSAQR
jgi:hypothetical protein